MKFDTVFYADDTSDSDSSDAQGHDQEWSPSLLRSAKGKGRKDKADGVSVRA